MSVGMMVAYNVTNAGTQNGRGQIPATPHFLNKYTEHRENSNYKDFFLKHNINYGCRYSYTLLNTIFFSPNRKILQWHPDYVLRQEFLA